MLELLPKSTRLNRRKALAWVGALLLVSGMTFGQTAAGPGAARQDQFSALAEQAKRAQQSGDFDKSVTLYTSALRQHPAWIEGWWQLASIHYELKHYNDALAAFRRVAALNPHNGAAFALAGLCEFNLSRYAQALKDLDHGGSLGLGTDQNLTPVVLYHAALLLTREGDFEQSSNQLALFVAAENHSPEIVTALGLNTVRLPLLPSEIPAAKRDLVMRAGEAAWQETSQNIEAARPLFAQLAADYPEDDSAQYAYANYLVDADPQLAFEEFKKALALNAGNVAASLKVAFFELQQGDAEGAMTLARQALVKLPNDYRVHLLMGRAYLQLNKTANAVLELRRAVEAAPDDFETRFYLAQAYRNSGDKPNADREQAEFDRLKKEDNSHTSIGGWWYFAGQYYKKQRYAEARDALAKVLAQSSKDSAAWAMMGLCDFELGDYQKSMEHLMAARRFGLAVDPALAVAVHLFLAELLNQAGRPEDALEEAVRSSNGQSASPQLKFVMGLSALRWKLLPAQVPKEKQALVATAGEGAWLLRSGQASDAASQFASLIASYPSEPNLHFNYALCLAILGDTDGARREFAKELEVNPNNGEAEANLALMDLKEGSNESALREAQGAVQMDNGGYLPHNALGWAALANHDTTLAVDEMKNAVRLAPDSAVMHFGLAQALKAAGQQREANAETVIFENLRRAASAPPQAKQ